MTGLLDTLKEVSSSPFAFVAYLTVVGGWVYSTYAVRRVKTVLRGVRKLSESDQLAALRQLTSRDLTAVPREQRFDYLIRRGRLWAYVATLIGAVVLITHVTYAYVETQRLYSSREAELTAARKELVKEIESNLWTANEHLGLAGTLASGRLWPAEAMAESLELIRIKMDQRPFSSSAYIAAKTRPELIAGDTWNKVEEFYDHLDEGINLNLRDTLETLESVIRMPFPEHELVCSSLETWAGTLEGHYHVLNVLGREALQGNVADESLQEMTSHMKFLRNASAEFGHADDLSTRLKDACAQAPRSPSFGFHCASLMLELKQLSGDVQDYVIVAVRSRSLHCESVSRAAYDTIIQRFPDDRVTVIYARTGLRQLDSPDVFLGARGLFVTDFASDSPGRDAGLHVGDVLLNYEGRPLNTFDELVAAISQARNQTVPATIVRNDTRMEVVLPRGRLGVEFQQF